MAEIRKTVNNVNDFVIGKNYVCIANRHRTDSLVVGGIYTCIVGAATNTFYPGWAIVQGPVGRKDSGYYMEGLDGILVGGHVLAPLNKPKRCRHRFLDVNVFVRGCKPVVKKRCKHCGEYPIGDSR